MPERYVLRSKRTGWYVYSYNKGPAFGCRPDIDDARIWCRSQAEGVLRAREGDPHLDRLEMVSVKVSIEEIPGG